MKIDLNANFRSRKEVLEGTNYIFRKIMDEAVGEIEYDEQAELKPKAKYPEEKVPVELVLLEGEGVSNTTISEEQTDEETEEESIDEAVQEARYIIARIKDLVEKETPVYNPKTEKTEKIKYKDIVVLMRSRTWYTTFVEEFKKAGLPLYAETDGGYFESIEVMTMLNTLKVIDNPYQDIPLVSVLRAPFVGLTEVELAQIRLIEKNKPQDLPSSPTYFDLLKHYMESEMQPEGKKKVEKFFRWFNEWRDFSRHSSIADLIWKVYNDTFYFEMVGAMVNGKQRQANLLALHDRALAYEKSSFRGLFRFLRFIDRMHMRGDDLGIAKSIGEAEDVVTLITIHKSKGLEFPVVFVAGMNRKFNNADFRSRYMFDDSFGIAVNTVNTELNFMTKSLPIMYIADKKRAKMKAEEMRILYVAMTRAKERLILVGSIKNWETTKEDWSKYENLQPNGVLPNHDRATANSYLSWVGPAIASHPEYSFVRYGDEHQEKTDVQEWIIQVISNDKFKQSAADEEEQEDMTKGEAQEELVSTLRERFNFTYNFEEATRQKSKTSVSEIKRMQALEELEQNPYTTVSTVFLTTPKPSFLREEKKRPLSAAQKGTALHVAMQHAPLTGIHTQEECKAYLQSLIDKQLLTQEEADSIVCEKVIAFFETDIGKRLINAQEVHKEVPFTLSLKTELGDAQIIQGVIDCLFKEADEKWILLDFKTDKILDYFAEGEALYKEIASRYRLQMDYYARAIETITGVKVKEKVLYLYDIGKEMPIID